MQQSQNHIAEVLHVVSSVPSWNPRMASGMGNIFSVKHCLHVKPMLHPFIHIHFVLMQEGGELEMEEEPEPAPYAKTLTMDRPW